MSVYINDINRKINQIIQYKNNIKEAIKAKGVDVADTDTFARYADKIAAIEQSTGGGSGGGEPSGENYEWALTGDYPSTTITWSGSTLRSYAFCRASGIQNMNCPNLTTIVDYVFSGCQMVSADFPNVTYISQMGLGNCSKLTYISLPNLQRISNYTFVACSALQEINLPKLTSTPWYNFQSCSKLSKVYFGSNFSVLSFGAFNYCYNLLSLTIMYPSVCKLGESKLFSDTPIGGRTTSTSGVYGSIYVPMSLVDSYKQSTNWIYYSNRIVGI